MTSITRRNALARIATVPAALAVGTGIAGAAHVVGDLPTASPDAELLALIDQHKAALDDLKAAQEAVEWIVDEYRHLWPLAPEEILGCANAQDLRLRSDSMLERDIAGRPLLRDTAPLFKRLSREFREVGVKTCFSIETPERLTLFLDGARSRTSRARSEAGRARDAKRRATRINEYERALVMSRQYVAETERLRNLSGIEAAKSLVTDRESSVHELSAALATHPVHTFEALVMKAKAVAADPTNRQHREVFQHLNAFRFAWTFMDDIQRVGGVS